MRTFGAQEYPELIYFNFEETPRLRALFEDSLNPQALLEKLGFFIGRKITSKALLCFDEIQIAPRALTALKYFTEQAPDYHVIAAGSLLGVQVGKPSSFPVGKVDFLTLYPMSFQEYLWASGHELLADHLLTQLPIHPIEAAFHQQLSDLLKRYLYLGGMPAVVKSYLAETDIGRARTLQQQILTAYENDFSKYADPTQAIRTSAFWRSVPYQLARENKKFKYSTIKEKARASTYELTIDWLLNAGLIQQVKQISTAKLPLGGYADGSKFKVYAHDVGLLGAMLQLSARMVTAPHALYREYHGAVIENYVANELTKAGLYPQYYWTSGRLAEVDFVLSYQEEIYPIEVKSGTNLNLKSLNRYSEKFQPRYRFRCSPRNFMKSDSFLNIPLYAIYLLPALLEKLNGRMS